MVYRYSEQNIANGDYCKGHALVCTSITVGEDFIDGLRMDVMMRRW